MPASRRLLALSLLSFLICSFVNAQERIQSMTSSVSTPTITMSASAGRVRFTAPGQAVRLRLEVFSGAGDVLFEGSIKGNVFDWALQDGAGLRLGDGSYLCVVTVKSLDGQVSQRIGTLSVQGDRVSGRTAKTEELTASQQQQAGPFGSNAALTILEENDTPSATVVAHDGADGRVTSTTGALTFRTGDVFAGQDKEQMRITEEGKVGIGTTAPQAALDVDGEVLARRGVRFEDGTTLNSVDGRLRRLDASGDPATAQDVSGSGTINRVVKWLDNAGTLGDSNILEVSGLSVFGQLSPLFQTAPSYHVIEVIAPGTKTPLVLAGGSGSMEFWKDFARGNGPQAAVAFGMGTPGQATTNDMVFSTYLAGQSWFERMRIASTGNVGIGTTNPQSKLDVAGAINTSIQYNIDGNRVMSNPWVDNIFVGVNAGRANTTGRQNAFFGFDAGAVNTTGGGNAFFGYLAGGSNTTANGNSFFGYVAGGNNTTGSGNAFFGDYAGSTNTTGGQNAFFGRAAGRNNTTGDSNSFFGTGVGNSNTTGGQNAFFGDDAGSTNTTGSQNAFFGLAAGRNNMTGHGNSYFGYSAGGNVVPGSGSDLTLIGANTEVGANNLVNATAIGARAFATQNNSLVLGSVSGQNGATADTNVGIGTTAPKARLHVQGGSVYLGGGGQGVILKSPDGAMCRLVTIDNAGAIVISTVACP